MSKSDEERTGKGQEKSAETPEGKDVRPQFSPPLVLENPNAPDVFASWVHAIGRREGNIHLTLCSDRYNQSEKKPTLVVIGRLVMPIAGVQDMVLALYNCLKDWGLDPAPRPPTDKLQ